MKKNTIIIVVILLFTTLFPGEADAQLPVAGFTFIPNEACATIPILFDTRNLSSGVGLNYSWDFGDGTSITTSNDTITHRYYSWSNSYCHAFETFNVTLIVTDTNSYTDTINQDINVGRLPYGNLLDESGNGFMLNYTTGGPEQDTLCVIADIEYPNCVDYINISWGDGTSQSSLTPNDFPRCHIYTGAGQYELGVFFMGTNGCYYDATYEVTLEATLTNAEYYFNDKLKIIPNPFTSTTFLCYTLVRPSNVSIRIFNSLGHLIEKIELVQSSGEHRVQWNADGLPPGIYYYRIQAGKRGGDGKIVLTN